VRIAWYVGQVMKSCGGVQDPEAGDSRHDGEHVWTAGQWRDLHKQSPFVWKVKIGHLHKNYPMSYINWDHEDSPNTRGTEGCVQMATHTTYQWNDWPCSYKLCFVCEINH